MAEKHSLGPWVPRPESRRYWRVEKGGYFIATCWGEENARLIAAAPELLEFAEEVRRSGDTRLASMAIAIIAKATGGAA